MRRIVGLVLVGIGVALIALAVALPTFVYPQVAKVPENPEQDIVAEGTGITSLVPSSVVSGGDGIFLDQTVRVTRTVIGAVPPNGSQVPEGEAFYQLAFEARVVDNPQLTGDDGLLQAYVEGGSFNGKTGASTNCCGDYLLKDPSSEVEAPGPDTAVTHDGLQFKFPFNTQRNQNYPFWDANIKAAALARYDGSEKVMGLQTYRFVQVIPDEVIGDQEIPGALMNLPDEQTVTAERVYQTVRTLWVEPYTGAIIKGSELVNQRLSYEGKEIPVINGKLSYTDETIRKNVEEYKSSASGLRFVSKIGPIGGWILGPIFALIGLTMLALSRRDNDEWEDEWDDDDDDVHGDDDDSEDEADDRSTASR